MILLSTPGQETQTACEADGNSLPISCPAREVINVINGFFGRTTRRICDKRYGWAWNIYCESEAAPGKIRDLCNGQNLCRVPTNVSDYDDPCFGTEKYVQVTYECLCKYCVGLGLGWGWGCPVGRNVM